MAAVGFLINGLQLLAAGYGRLDNRNLVVFGKGSFFLKRFVAVDKRLDAKVGEYIFGMYGAGEINAIQ